MMDKQSENEAYWAARATAYEEAWHNRCQTTVERDLAAYYEQALADIQRDIAALYGRFAKDNKLSMAEAHRLLTGDEYRVWRMSMEEYLQGIENGSVLSEELDTLAMRSRISRLDKLYAETLKALDRLGRKTEDRMTDFLIDAYKDRFYHGIYDVAERMGIMKANVAIDDDAAQKIAAAPWSGKSYSQRIWKNDQQLGTALRAVVSNGLHRGLSVPQMAKMVEDKMHAGLSNARRLVRTEMNYVQNRAAVDSIKESGMKYYRFIATLDRRTSAICRSHDGHVYSIDEYRPGENAPPLHPNCRSTIAGSLKGWHNEEGTRAARNIDGKTIQVPKNMKYGDWKAVYVDRAKTLEDWKKQNNYGILNVTGIPKTWKAIVGSHSLEDDVSQANPNYKLGHEYTVNCQRCVQVAELRRRGYDVVALPQPVAGEANPIIWGCECFASPTAGEEAKDAAARMFTWWQTAAAVKKELSNAPNGARYVIYVKWKGRNTGAHVFIGQKEQRVVRYLDPQVGANDVEWFFSQGRKGSFGFCRIDDKTITSDEKILSATAKSR